MPYEKHEWQTGETITAGKLNHIEDGIAAAQPKIKTVFLTSDDYLVAEWTENCIMLAVNSDYDRIADRIIDGFIILSSKSSQQFFEYLKLSDYGQGQVDFTSVRQISSENNSYIKSVCFYVLEPEEE